MVSVHPSPTRVWGPASGLAKWLQELDARPGVQPLAVLSWTCHWTPSPCSAQLSLPHGGRGGRGGRTCTLALL